MSLYGIITGFSAFLIIGLFHPLVIKGEYHFGVKIWPVFLAAGMILCVISVLVKNVLLSTLLGVIAFCSFWSIRELFQQRKRVERGWFPKKSDTGKEENDRSA